MTIVPVTAIDAHPPGPELCLFDDGDCIRVEIEDTRNGSERQRADAGFEAIGEEVVRLEQDDAEAFALLAQKRPEGGELACVDGGARTRLIVSGRGDAERDGHLVLPC
jgi:hypothetical protein